MLRLEQPKIISYEQNGENPGDTFTRQKLAQEKMQGENYADCVSFLKDTALFDDDPKNPEVHILGNKFIYTGITPEGFPIFQHTKTDATIKVILDLSQKNRPARLLYRLPRHALFYHDKEYASPNNKKDLSATLLKYESLFTNVNFARKVFQDDTILFNQETELMVPLGAVPTTFKFSHTEGDTSYFYQPESKQIFGIGPNGFVGQKVKGETIVTEQIGDTLKQLCRYLEGR